MKKMTVATDPNLLREYDQLTRGLSNVFYGQLLNLVGNLDTGSKAELRNSLIKTYPELLSPFMESSANIGATFYEANRSLAVGGSYSALVARPSLSSLALEGLIRFAVSPLGMELGLMLVTKILSYAGERMMQGAGRDSIALNVGVDDSAYGYARVPEPDACEFCAMLSTRVYGSEKIALDVTGVDRRLPGWRKDPNPVWVKAARGNQSLGDDYHDNCQCRTVPVFGSTGDQYEDIIAVNPDAEKYLDIYGTAYDMSADASEGERTKAILANMRQLMKL